MMESILIAVFSALSAGIMAYIGMRFFAQAGQKYQENFTNQARVHLADLFLLIEPEKLFVLNTIMIIVTFILSFIVFGNLVLSIIFSVLMGFVPQITLKILTKRRRQLFISQLPDMLQSSSTAMKAGSSLNQAIEAVVSEESGPISQEFDLFLRELRVGVDFNQALDNIYVRVPLMDFKLVVSGMQISKEIGGNLAETLERLADTLRRKLEMEGKIDALTSQGRAQGIVMTSLPLLLGYILYLMEPEQMSLLWTQWYGWVVMAIVFFMELAGYLVIRKIVNIDV